MILIANKTHLLSGHVIPPTSKSQSIRGIFLALLSQGESVLNRFLHSEDTQDALRVCRSLGAETNLHGNTLTIKSAGLPLQPKISLINTGNSGITTRFVMPVLGLRHNHNEPIMLDCDSQMRKRPISPLVNALRNLGITINYIETESLLPISVSGKLQGGKTEIDGITSQYISALLLSLPLAPHDSEIIVHHLHERPYMEMTLEKLRARHIHYQHTIKKSTSGIPLSDHFIIPGKQNYFNFSETIPSDFSSASYLIAAAVLIPGHVVIEGLNLEDTQGDKKIITILQQMGADISIQHNSLIINGGKLLSGLTIDANDIPDLLPTLAVIGTFAKGKTSIINVEQARIKETDRIHSMSEGLQKMGAKVEEYPDGITLYESKLHGAFVKGYDDHRTVMALCLAGMLADGKTEISDAHAISKTFPTFISLMKSVGANIDVSNGDIKENDHE